MRDESVIAGARERLFERPSLPALRAHAARRRVMFGGFALAGAAAAAAVMLVLGRGPRAMGFEVGMPPASGNPGAWIAAPAGAAVPLRFDDGSRFEVGPSARARVASSMRADARLVLESGKLSGDVSPPPTGASWQLTAGPFDLTVSGARFETAWDPDHEVLEVQDVSGRVVVRGPHVTEGLVLATGGHLRVSLKEGRLEVTTAAPRPEPAPSSSPAPSSAPNASSEKPE
jgi:hypothetical protein